MYFKRFVQLFVVFLITISISEALAALFHVQALGWRILFITIVGYICLTIPLTIMTVMKNRKKFAQAKSGDNSSKFRQAMEELPNLVALATANTAGQMSDNIITYKLSRTEDNVLYMVSDWKATRVKNLQANSNAAFTTWFDADKGLRVHSNQLHAQVLDASENEREIKAHPELLDLSANAQNQAIIKLELQSAVIESFQGAPEVISW
ncbi:pyridoxamine 5'-phosphate oxidase family protein [Eupransor demetentiae]|uniref:Pyridoxamine 5'-phosphate oxidase putative domain-containing protein n=1 Tax=Eupransor demetentiae TaxID=3109584 RepID=A0ABP0ENH1_9LACO|nr:hypothetical protein R54876_GBNLAHCA_00391 [Lactobacillaceae bacterium LMG 33000]